VQNASQEKNESPEIFLDRLRKLCQRTIRSSDNPVEQAVINQEADRRLLAAFINGLTGAPGKQVMLQMPINIDRALNVAMIATNAEKEEKASVRGDRGSNYRVFAVRGNRAEGNREMERGMAWDLDMRTPRGKFQWSSNRGAVSQHRAGPVQNSTGDTGSTPAGQKIGLPRIRRPMQGPWKGARIQGRRTMTIVGRHDHGTFVVIVVGFWDISERGVLEGKREI
jgi:hypothetical protein